MQKDIYYRRLAEKYIRNQCTPEEIKELLDYFDKSASNRLLLEKIREQFQLAMERPQIIPDEVSHRMEEKLIQNIPDTRVASTRRKRILRSVAAAAALLILFSSIYFLANQKPASSNRAQVKKGVKKNDVLPGGNRAVLTLANGTTIILDSAQKGMLASQGGSRVLKINNGKLAYNNEDHGHSGQVLYNTISTPRGGQYQVVLPDGSKVWLNAASSLEFPVAFHGAERKVKLTGEAYFEIVKDKDMPFKVMVEDMAIAVLGTHFNVMAYPGETAIKTTLLEGAVKVIGNNNSVLLKPGMQAQLYKAKGYFKAVRADTGMAVAWKNGYFSFNSTSIYDIMRKISRWYDVDISYKDSLSVRFNGHISRNVNVSEVFRILELTKEVHFGISGRKIIVSK